MFRLAADRALQLADVNFEEIPDAFVEIKEIIRESTDGNLTLKVVDDKHISVLKDGKVKITVTCGEMSTLAVETYQSMISTKDYESAELFLERAGIKHIKTSNRSKTDLLLKLYDPRTGTEPVMKYSIKSDVGSDSTLYNATPGTEIVFEIEGPLTDEIATKINSFKGDTKIKDSEAASKANGKVKKKFVYMNDKGYRLKYLQKDDVFTNNLTLIDTAFPRILAEMALKYYSGYRLNRVDAITELIAKDNPVGVPQSICKDFYEHKVKSFLVSAALGMTQGTPWDVRETVTGGIILVKKSGDIVCYHLFDRGEFEEHLYRAAKLDTPSTKRHKNPEIYKTVEGKYNISLALQIRLSKDLGADKIDQP